MRQMWLSGRKMAIDSMRPRYKLFIERVHQLLQAGYASMTSEELRHFNLRSEPDITAALAMQIVTGLTLAWRLLPDVPAWFAADSAVSRLILLKLGLLAMTALVAAHARLRVIPRLQAATLPLMAAHVAAVTVLSVLFVAAGISLRTGWLG